MKIKLLRLEDDWALRDRSVLARNRKSLPRSALTLIDMLIKAEAGGKKS